MDIPKAIEHLRRLRDELTALPATNKSAQFESWNERTRSVRARSLGASHHITERFGSLTWIDRVVGGDSMDVRAFHAARTKAEGLIDAAIFELEELSAPDAGGAGLAEGHPARGVVLTRRRAGAHWAAGTGGGAGSGHGFRDRAVVRGRRPGRCRAFPPRRVRPR